MRQHFREAAIDLDLHYLAWRMFAKHCAKNGKSLENGHLQIFLKDLGY